MSDRLDRINEYLEAADERHLPVATWQASTLVNLVFATRLIVDELKELKEAKTIPGEELTVEDSDYLGEVYGQFTDLKESLIEELEAKVENLQKSVFHAEKKWENLLEQYLELQRKHNLNKA